jgi:hypothetical protein
MDGICTTTMQFNIYIQVLVEEFKVERQVSFLINNTIASRRRGI